MDKRQNRSLINFLVVTGDGAMFIDGVDTSRQIKDADFIAKELVKRINSLGCDNIVQVVTDSAGKCVAARDKLRMKYKSMVFSPCSALCLYLLWKMSASCLGRETLSQKVMTL